MQLQRLASERRITSWPGKTKSTGWPRILRNGRDKHYFSVLKYLTAEENLNFKVTWWWNHRFAKHATCMVWMTSAKFLFLLQNCMVFSQRAPGSFTVMYSSWSYCKIHSALCQNRKGYKLQTIIALHLTFLSERLCLLFLWKNSLKR